MAQITPDTEFAPDESVHYSFPDGEFDLSPGDTYETAYPQLIDSASAHPWLRVEVPVEAVVARYRDTQPDPKTDPLSGENPANQAALTVEAAEEFENSKWVPTTTEVVSGPPFTDEVTEDFPPAEDTTSDPVVNDAPADDFFTNDPTTEDNS